jgi:glycosyltransferase involved in cell wall biosynthesis
MILATTPAIAEEMAVRHGAAKLRVWGRGVDTDLFDPARRSEDWRAAHGIAAEDVALLFFGRLVVEKGTDVFAEVSAGLRALGHRVRPVIIGAGPAEARLRAALPEAIFTGHLTGEALATAIASSDVMLNPSLTETFGNVTLEAMASGLALVAADVASTRNLVSDGRDALVSPPDAQSYVARIAGLIADPARRVALGTAARATAFGWRWDQVLDTVLESYALLLRDKEA